MREIRILSHPEKENVPQRQLKGCVNEMCVNLRYSAHLDIVTLDIEALLLTAASAPMELKPKALHE